MSYIRAKKTDVEEGAVHLELPDHDEAGMELDLELDAEGALSFVTGLIEQVNELSEGEALVIYKEIF